MVTQANSHDFPSISRYAGKSPDTPKRLIYKEKNSFFHVYVGCFPVFPLSSILWPISDQRQRYRQNAGKPGKREFRLAGPVITGFAFSRSCGKKTGAREIPGRMSS